MYITKNKLFTFIFVLFLAGSSFAQFKINEYSCANVSGQVDALGNTPDWFEIYNTTTSTKFLTGYYVSNDINQKGKWQFPIGTSVPAQSFILVYASGLDTVIAGEYHTNFDLLQTKGEKIILSNNQGNVIDSVTIRRHQHNHAWARIPNGSGTWKVFARNPVSNIPTWTPGTTNVVTGLRSFIGYLPSPIFDLPGGFYSGPTQVSLSEVSNATFDLIDPQIYFTGSNFFTGANPGVTNTLKRQFFDPAGGTPIFIDSTTVIRAYLDTNNTGLGLGYLPSFMETHTYFINSSNIFPSTGQPINTDFTLPTVSITYDTATVGSYPGAAPINTNFYMLSMEYYDANGNFKFQTVGSTPAPFGDDALPNSLGGINYYADDEFGYSYTNKQQFYTNSTLKTSSRTEQVSINFRAAADDKFPFESDSTNGEYATHMRDAMAQTYAMKNNLDLDGSRYQPCIMYLNGKYWGVYEIREVFDAEYLKHYYGVTPEKVQVLQNNGILQGFPPLQAAYDWGNLVSFITTNDMANDSLLALADSMLSFSSLIDLIIYNGYTANGEFPNKASWWRAPDTSSSAIKWRYHMFDMDDIFGLGKNNSGLTSTDPDASTCQHQNLFNTVTDSSRAHLAIFNSLMTSDTFKSAYINRYSYLLNTSLKCNAIISHITNVKNILYPEMAQHTAKWGSTNTTWSFCVDTMKYWINQHCANVVDDINNCYNVTGPLRFCTEIEPEGTGSVVLNNVSYPEDHSDQYFANVYFNAIAVPNENYYFDHWESIDFTLPDSILRNDSIQWHFDSVSCVKAVFKLKEPYNLVGEPIVPTGFSPNGDGNNDFLNVYGTRETTEFNLEIYNRWGQRIFQSSDKTKGWDGNYNGSEAPVGVYAYTFKVTIDGEIIQKSGSITLIR